MKKIYYFLTSLFIFSGLIVKPQWSTDPANPGVVCDFNEKQNNQQVLIDDNGGVYVFWLDGRNDIGDGQRDIYGQYYDAEGYALWEEDGRQIANHYNKITWFNVSRSFNQEIIIGWASSSAAYPYNDSLRIQRLDDNGAKVWATDLLVANAAPSPVSILSVDSYRIIHDNTGYCISIQVVYYGGSNGNRITRFASDGVLTGTYGGEPEGTQYNFGNSGLLRSYNSFDDSYLYYSGGNGAGAGLYCLKTDLAGDTIWGPVNVLEGTNGLSYQFSAISDENGITFAWQGNGINVENLYARRLNANGSLGWNGSTLNICVADGTQTNFFLRNSGDNYYMVWADGRPGTNPGNFDIYAQKFDVNGNLYWTADGVEVTSLGTYIPHPKFAFSDNNSIVVCHGSSSGFVAQKILDNGSKAWNQEGLICTTAFDPDYDNHSEIGSGNNVIAAWTKGGGVGADNIYITRIDIMSITGTSELSEDQILVYPNPVSENIHLVLPEHLINTNVRITDCTGRDLQNYTVTHSDIGRLSISVNDMPGGIYFLTVQNGSQTAIRKLIIGDR